MAIKEFATAAERAQRAAEEEGNGVGPITVTVAERDITFWFPGTGQMAAFAALTATDQDNLIIMGKAINWVVSLLQPDLLPTDTGDEEKDAAAEEENTSRIEQAEEDQRFLQRMLLTKGNGFEADVFVDIAMYLFGEWSGKAEGSRRGSSSSRPSTGAKSTAASRRAGKGTPSRSRSTGSAP